MSQLFFRKPFQDAILAGRKRTTIRRWEKPRVSPGGRVFSPGLGWLLIEAVEPVELAAMSQSDADEDGFESTEEMGRLLYALYPDHATDGKRWFRVRFHLHARWHRVKGKATARGGRRKAKPARRRPPR